MLGLYVPDPTDRLKLNFVRPKENGDLVCDLCGRTDCKYIDWDSTHFFIPAADVQDLNMLRGWLANTAFCYKSRVFGQTKAFLEHSFLTTLKANKAWQNLTRILDLLFSIFSLSPVIWHF